MSAAYAAAAAASEAVVVVEYVLEKEGRGFGGVGQRAEMACVGTIATPDGLVVISSNVFPEDETESRTPARPHSFEAILRGGERVKADFVGREKDSALAFLRLAGGRTYPHVAFETGGDLEPGSRLLLLSLLPEKYDHRAAVVVSRVAAVIDTPRRLYDVEFFVQDSMVGTPVLDERGRVVGILASDPLGDDTGRALSAPLKLIGAVTRNKEPGFPVLVPAGAIAPLVANPPRVQPLSPSEHSWLGVTLQPVPRALAKYLRISPPTGVMVTSVWSGSPAEAAGLVAEDVIVSFDGKPVEATDDEALPLFIDAVRTTPVGKTVELRVVRGGKAQPVRLQLAAAPKTAIRADEYRSERFGLVAQDVTRDVIMSRGWPEETSGALVSDVETAGWAQVGGVQEGDLILAVNGQPVSGVEDLEAAFGRAEEEQPAEVVFFVLRDPDTLFVPVKTEW